jgi:hypothetical protein
MSEVETKAETTEAVSSAPAPVHVEAKPAEKPAELNTEIQQKWASILASKPGALEDLVQRVEVLKGVDPRVHALEIKNAKNEAIIEHDLSKDDLALLGDVSPEQVAANAKALKARYNAIAEAAKTEAAEMPAAKNGGVKLPEIDPELAKTDPIGAAVKATVQAFKSK